MKKVKKHYRIREFSPLWWICFVGAIGAITVMAGLMNSWELGLLQ